MKNNKLFFAILIFPFFLFGFSFDTEMPDEISTYQTHPFFLNIYCSENPLISENQMQEANIFAERGRTFSGSMYSFMAKKLYYDFLNETGYSFFEIPKDVSYDISIIRDIYSTRLYSSLGKEDSFTKVNSFTRAYIENTSVKEHQTQFYGEYRNVVFDLNVLQGDFEALAGYSNDIIDIKGGFDNNDRIVAKEGVSLFGLFIYSDIKYNYKTESIKSFVFSKYHFNLGKVHIVPQVIYDSVITAQAGILYRIIPEASAYANYSRRGNADIITSGIKYFSDNIDMDILPICYSRDGFMAKTSVDVSYAYFTLNGNVSYQDSFQFDVFSTFSFHLFQGNLIPKVIVGYDSFKKIDAFIDLKIIDVNIFFGSRFFMDTKEYLVKGGLTWLFLD